MWTTIPFLTVIFDQLCCGVTDPLDESNLVPLVRLAISPIAMKQRQTVLWTFPVLLLTLRASTGVVCAFGLLADWHDDCLSAGLAKSTFMARASSLNRVHL